MRGKDPRPIVVMVLMLVALLGPTLAAAAQTTPPSSHIVAIDTRTGMVSAKVNATGEDFQFTLINTALVATLKIGQGVYANFQAKQISLDGQHVAGTILSTGAPKAPIAPGVPGKAPAPSEAGSGPKTPVPSQPSASNSPASGANPACCGITGIDAPARRVAAKDNSTNRAFQFSVPNSSPIQNLRDGQPVLANFKTRKVSLDGQTACCDIVSFGAAGDVNTSLSTQAAGKAGGGRPLLAGYAEIDPCTITSADILKALLQTDIQSFFPVAIDNGGEHIRITHPNVEQVLCPNMVIKVHADFGYSQTQGFPQFQTGGTMELQSSLVAQVTYQGGSVTANPVITAANFVRAVAVLRNPQVTSVQVNNIPSWIDLTWITDCLNGKYSNWGCTDILHAMSFDVTALFKFYLEQGHSIPVPNAAPPAQLGATPTGSKSGLTAVVTEASPSGPASPKPPGTQGPAGATTPAATPEGVFKRGAKATEPPAAAAGKFSRKAVVTRIDRRSGLVTAQDKTTGRTFFFKLGNLSLLQSLNLGSAVHVNYPKGEVSLGHTQAAGKILLPILPAPPRLRSTGDVSATGLAAIANGKVAAASTTAAPPPNSFTFRTIDIPNSYPATVTLISINDAGVVLGQFFDAGANGQWHYFLELGGRPSYATIELPWGPVGINNTGEIIGCTIDSNGAVHGYRVTVRSPLARDLSQSMVMPAKATARRLELGAFSTFDDPDACGLGEFCGTCPYGINNKGEIVGSFSDSTTSHGFLYSGGRFTTIDFPGALITTLISINDSGQIVGTAASLGAPWQYFLYSAGRFSTVDEPLGGVAESVANGSTINDSGQVVGSIVYADATGHCFLATSTSFTFLDAPGTTGTVCTTMNYKGQIGGEFCSTGADCHAFVATPIIPSPSAPQ